MELVPSTGAAQSIVLGSFRIDPPLDPGHSYTRTIAFNLPNKIQGVYTIKITTDAGSEVDSVLRSK